MKKKILCSLLALLVVNLSFPHVVRANEVTIVASGNCGIEGDGSNVKWELDSNGTLTISGSGKMKGSNHTADMPFYEHSKNIKSVTIEPGVTSIGVYAFHGCSSLTSITIPDSVTSIGDSAFCFCTSLTSVAIPDSVTSIGDSAFCNCIRLTSVTIPDSVESIGNYAFDGCTRLTSVTIPDSVTSIGIQAFARCTSLTSVTIPDRVTSIGDYAFYKCSSLTSVTIPYGVTSIGDSAFYKCSSLTSVTIPDRVTSIGDSAFEGCSSLTSVTIPDSVTSIGNYAFRGCTSLTSVTIPDSVTSIGNNAFYGCTSLKTFFYKEGLDLTNASIPSETVKIAYTVTNKQDGKTEVTLVNTSQDVTIKCNAMGEYKITANNTVGNDKKVILKHNLPADWDEGDNEKHWKVCSICSEKQNKESHSFEPKSNSNNHWEECSVCGAIKDEAEHTWDNGKVKTPATCTEAGTRLYTCNVCNATKEGTIEALGHSFSEEKFAPTTDNLGGTKYTCSDCGYEYWEDLSRGNMSSQTLMPDGGNIYHYCKQNSLVAEEFVNIGDGQELKVVLLDPLNVLESNGKLGLKVEYVTKDSARYNELMSQVDDTHPIEHINFFEVSPTVDEASRAIPSDGSVYMMYEIPEGWDESDLEMILVRDGDDQEFDEKVLEIDGKKYLAMWKHLML